MKRNRERAVAALAMTAWLGQSIAAQACEGCKQAVQNGMGEDQVSAASLGYGWSVGFMLIMTFSVIGSLAFMVLRSCQTLSRAQALAENEQRLDR